MFAVARVILKSADVDKGSSHVSLLFSADIYQAFNGDDCEAMPLPRLLRRY